MTATNNRDADRLVLLDRLTERVPQLDLDRQLVEWRMLPDGHEALLVNGGGIDGGKGAYFRQPLRGRTRRGVAGPLVPGHVGCIVIRPDGSRVFARARPVDAEQLVAAMVEARPSILVRASSYTRPAGR
jgi:hypothetical protein